MDNILININCRFICGIKFRPYALELIEFLIHRNVRSQKIQMSWSRSVTIVNRLRDRRPSNRGSISFRDRGVSFSHSVQTGSGAHLLSYTVGFRVL